MIETFKEIFIWLINTLQDRILEFPFHHRTLKEALIWHQNIYDNTFGKEVIKEKKRGIDHAISFCDDKEEYSTLYPK